MTATAFPRFVPIAGRPVSAYKVFLCAGLHAAILAGALSAERSGLSPLRVGAGLLLCAIVGMAGARLYYLALSGRVHAKALVARSATDAGWSVLGGLLIVPFAFLIAPVLGIPAAVFWDHVAVAIAVGGAFIRLGCVCNGCCVGRASDGWLALRQRDPAGEVRRRLPAPWLEVGWWLLACAGLAWLRTRALPAGTAALAVLAWYGLGRFWLEPLRAGPQLVRGVRVDRVVAALLAITAGVGLLWRTT